MSNGCGCETGILKYIKPPYAKMFYVPCCIHDDDYDRGGTEYMRKCADYSLYIRMKALIDKGEWNYIKQKWLKLWAWIYYKSVRIFGRFYFNYIKYW